MLLHLGQVPTLVVSSAEIVEEIVKNHDVLFSDRPSMTTTKILLYRGTAGFIFAPYGEYWRKVKKIIVHELLSNKRVQSSQVVREEEVASLINKIHHASSNRSSINLTEMVLATSHRIISRCIIGQKAREEDGKIGELSKRLANQVGDFSFGDLFPFIGWLDVVTGLVRRLKTTFNEMDAFLESVIEGQKALASDMDDQNHKDFVQILLHLIQQDDMFDTRLTQDNLKAILLVSIPPSTKIL
ncbi:hypothetical protein PTKIN_Ptkin05aG0191100 [Pterospermum kingtungense]